MQNPVILSQLVPSPLFPVQWKREQDFDLQLLERAVQGEEAQAVRSVQGEESRSEHKERPRSHSDEWLTFCSTAMSPPANEVDLEPLDYDADLNKEVQELISALLLIIGRYKLKSVQTGVGKMDDTTKTTMSSSQAGGESERLVGIVRELLLTCCLCAFFVQLSLPQKVLIPERYVDSEPEEPLSPQEVEDRHRKVERIKSLLAKSR